ncbi:hypothetical protein [Niameybacter massiliensis]|nr:hypothetical protein [Niameybacter massiliensis]
MEAEKYYKYEIRFNRNTCTTEELEADGYTILGFEDEWIICTVL